jgi:hypothetical protein
MRYNRVAEVNLARKTSYFISAASYGAFILRRTEIICFPSRPKHMQQKNNAVGITTQFFGQ